MTKKRIDKIYCDGASRKDGRGGWGFAIFRGNWEMAYACGGEYSTTNNRMELLAAIRALQWLPENAEAIVISDSKYVVDGIVDTLDIWLKNGWRTSANKPVKNQDLWIELGRLDMERQIDWRWVKGHSGVPGNERADVLAGLGVPKEI